MDSYAPAGKRKSDGTTEEQNLVDAKRAHAARK